MYKIISTCKGGGYMYCRTEPPHPRANANGLYPLHRVIVENRIGRPLRKDEHVHHIDENKANNSDENLAVLSASAHALLHRPSLPMAEAVCYQCGSTFHVKRHVLRQRLERSKSGKIVCSRECLRQHLIDLMAG